MNFPEDLKYTKDHEWIRISDQEAYVGITDFAQNELGDVVFVDIDTVGETLSQGETFGAVDAVKTASDVYMPVSGEVLAVNPDLADAPEWVNKDPYGKGWMIRIRITEPSDCDTLMDAEAYQAAL